MASCYLLLIVRDTFIDNSRLSLWGTNLFTLKHYLHQLIVHIKFGIYIYIYKSYLAVYRGQIDKLFAIFNIELNNNNDNNNNSLSKFLYKNGF